MTSGSLLHGTLLQRLLTVSVVHCIFALPIEILSTVMTKHKECSVVDTASHQVGGKVSVQFEDDHGEAFVKDIYENYLELVSVR